MEQQNSANMAEYDQAQQAWADGQMIATADASQNQANEDYQAHVQVWQAETPVTGAMGFKTVAEVMAYVDNLLHPPENDKAVTDDNKGDGPKMLAGVGMSIGDIINSADQGGEITAASLNVPKGSSVRNGFETMIKKMKIGDKISGDEIAKLGPGFGFAHHLNSITRTEDGFKADIPSGWAWTLGIAGYKNLDGSVFQFKEVGMLLQISSNQATYKGNPLVIYIGQNTWSDDNKKTWTVFKSK